jgi:N-acetylglucosamine kinase-like BadF-type ATPase
MKKKSTGAHLDQLALIDSEPGKFAFYTWQNIIIVVWLNQATGAAVKRLIDVTQSMADAHPDGISKVHIIFDGAGVPTSEARSGFVNLIKKFGKQLACVEVVMLGGGFWASAMRAAVTGIKMIAPQLFPIRIHGSLAEAAQALQTDHLKQTRVQVDPDMLLGVLETAQRQQASSPPSENK